MVWYGMVWYGMVWYGMVWYGMVWYGMVWYGMVLYIMVCFLFKQISSPISNIVRNWIRRIRHCKVLYKSPLAFNCRSYNVNFFIFSSNQQIRMADGRNIQRPNNSMNIQNYSSIIFLLFPKAELRILLIKRSMFKNDDMVVSTISL